VPSPTDHNLSVLRAVPLDNVAFYSLAPFTSVFEDPGCMPSRDERNEQAKLAHDLTARGGCATARFFSRDALFENARLCSALAYTWSAGARKEGFFSQT
jgi:hypothetical protein